MLAADANLEGRVREPALLDRSVNQQANSLLVQDLYTRTVGQSLA